MKQENYETAIQLSEAIKERDQLKAELAKAKIENLKLSAALQAIINLEPCMAGGVCLYPMFDGEGNPIGEQNVDPLGVIQQMVDAAHKPAMNTSEIQDCPKCGRPIVCGSAVAGLACECSLAAPVGSATGLHIIWRERNGNVVSLLIPGGDSTDAALHVKNALTQGAVAVNVMLETVESPNSVIQPNSANKD